MSEVTVVCGSRRAGKSAIIQYIAAQLRREGKTVVWVGPADIKTEGRPWIPKTLLGTLNVLVEEESRK